MNKTKRAIGEQLEQTGDVIGVAGVHVAHANDAPAVHLAAVLEFVDGLRKACAHAKREGLDTITASNDPSSWESVLGSLQVAADALALQIVDKKRVRS